MNIRSSAAGEPGPPYAYPMAMLGGIPNNQVDTPICATFIGLYLICAITNTTILSLNARRKHKFLVSNVITGFCMIRTLTCALRIGWANRLDNVSLGIAATIFTNLGIFALFIVNVILSQRILRSRRPSIGWHKGLRGIFIAIYSSIALCVVLLVPMTVESYYTLDMGIRLAARDVELAVATWLLIITVTPYVFVAVAYCMPSGSTDSGSTQKDIEIFGKGHHLTQLSTLVVLTTLMVLDQGYKVGVDWVLTPHARDDAPWYDAKVYFYVLGFMLEIIYLVVVLSLRIDVMFHIPDGSSKRKTYGVHEADLTSEASSDEEKSIDSMNDQ